ncbi:phosphotransferase system, HPr-related domain protein [Chlamydia pecorum]|uniref:Phosphotransferase system, HPr-related domain protein n=1 Tax=Chlamydia pecorum TaxID=85991 RepID=A0AA40PPY1_9CHLA|nr:HPr family phosphocarrier protein [Chlamydia pecorum]KTF28556.1 phosphotransferase system, HPr-related domain protein [Chlamydia pecorum]
MCIVRRRLVNSNAQDCVYSSAHADANECFAVCVVKNPSGIHVRPAGTLVLLLEGEECEVSFTFGKKTINAKSIMSILMLGVPQGGEVMVSVQGKDAQRVLKKLQDAFESGFGEIHE